MAEPQMPAVVSAQAQGRDWFKAGSCRRGDLDPDTWFPVSKDPAASEEPKRVCAQCPVRSRCISESLKIPDEKGIWGGLDELDRRRLPMVSV
jgi:WhiB family redox-sensing transcriptional regulator